MYSCTHRKTDYCMQYKKYKSKCYSKPGEYHTEKEEKRNEEPARARTHAVLTSLQTSNQHHNKHQM